MSSGGCIPSVFIVSTMLSSDLWLAGLCCSFYLLQQLPSFPPPNHPSLGERLAWGNRLNLYTAFVPHGSTQLSVKGSHSPLQGSDPTNRGSCVQPYKYQSQIHGFLGVSPVLFWGGVNPITAGIKLIKTLQNYMAETSPEMVFQPSENTWS